MVGILPGLLVDNQVFSQWIGFRPSELHYASVHCVLCYKMHSVSMQTPQMHLVLWGTSLRCISAEPQPSALAAQLFLCSLANCKERNWAFPSDSHSCVIVSQIQCSIWLFQWSVIMCWIKGKLQMMFGDLPVTGRVDVSSHSQNPPTLSWWYFPTLSDRSANLNLLLSNNSVMAVKSISEEVAWRRFFDRWL